MRKRFTTDQTRSRTAVSITGARVLVVDDHPDAAHLIGKLIRAAGYEVAETTDPQVALATVLDAPAAVDAVIASFTTSGTHGALRFLDAVRHHQDAGVSGLRVLLVSDQPRQQIFCLQAGADAILLRPYRAAELSDALTHMLRRPEAAREDYRRRKVDELKGQMPHPLSPCVG